MIMEDKKSLTAVLQSTGKYSRFGRDNYRSAMLFHGSGTPGITKFKPTHFGSWGSGVYLAYDEGTAKAYARLSDSGHIPTLYKVGFKRPMKMLDISETETLRNIIKSFSAYSRVGYDEFTNTSIASMPKPEMYSFLRRIIMDAGMRNFQEYVRFSGYDGISTDKECVVYNYKNLRKISEEELPVQ